MGISGAAYATVISQALQFFILIAASRRLVRRQKLSVGIFTGLGKSFAALVRQSLNVLKFGIPAGGYDILNMLSFTIFVFVTGTMSEVDFAASNACFTINYLSYAPLTGFALAAQTLVGQSIGRADCEGASRYLKYTIALVLLFAAVIIGGIIVFCDPVLSLFAPSDAALSAQFIELGRPLVWLMCTWILFDAVDIVLSGALRGAGDTRFVFVWMLICSFVLWMPLVFIVKVFNGTMFQLWSTMILYAVTIAIGTIWRWRGGRWKSIKVISVA